MKGKKEENHLFTAVILVLVVLLIAYSLISDPTIRGKQTFCGNNVVEPGEQCDPPWTGVCPFVSPGTVPFVCGGSCQCQLQNAQGVIPYIQSFSKDVVVSPESGFETVRVTGTNFINPATNQPVTVLAEGIPLLPTAYTVLNSNTIDVRISPVMTPRSYKIEMRAINPLNGQPLRSNPKSFTIAGRPSIASASPQVIVSNAQPNMVTLTGANFLPYNFDQPSLVPTEVFINNVRYNPSLVRVNGYAQIQIIVQPYPPAGPYPIYVSNTHLVPAQTPALRLLNSNTVYVVVAPPGCGNTVLEQGEQCDPPGTTQGSNRCSSSCQWTPVSGPSQPSQPTSPSRRSGGSSGGVFTIRFDLDDDRTYERTVRRGNVIVAKIGTKSYTVRVQDVTTSEVVFKTPNSDLVEIAPGNSGDMKLDSDNVPDLTAAVQEIVRQQRAVVVFSRYAASPQLPPVTPLPPRRYQPPREPAIEPPEEYPETPEYSEYPEYPVEPTERRGASTYVFACVSGILIVIVIALAVILIMRKRRGKSSTY